jgi:hypothetical protein
MLETFPLHVHLLTTFLVLQYRNTYDVPSIVADLLTTFLEINVHRIHFYCIKIGPLKARQNGINVQHA